MLVPRLGAGFRIRIPRTRSPLITVCFIDTTAYGQILVQDPNRGHWHFNPHGNDLDALEADSVAVVVEVGSTALLDSLGGGAKDA